jgi:hypothetical protein
MPLDVVAVPFVIVAFLAIGWRFVVHSADRSGGLPRVVDESVGMWLVRRALGRPTTPSDYDDDELPEPAADEIAYRIGVPGATPPAVRRGALTAVAGRPVRRRRSRPNGSLGAQRRSAGAVALAVVAIAVTTVALGGRQLEGAVLSATGTPDDSSDGGFVGGSGGPEAASGSPDQGETRLPVISSLSAESTPSPEPAAPPAGGTLVPTPRLATPRPPATPRPTVRPTPRPTLTPTPTPTAGGTPAPPTPTPAPTNTPEPEPSASP